MELETRWLGRIGYHAAWDLQHDLVRARASGAVPDQLLLLEHEPVLTLGRHSDPSFVRATDDQLRERGIELIRVERGGEVTYHGPGQLTAYPIVRLADRGVLIRPFVRALEAAMVDTARHFGVEAGRRDGYPGCYVDPAAERPRKLGALGIRIEHGVTYHGIAFNVTTRLEDFDLIDPCGMPGLDVTSIAREAGWTAAESEASTGLVGQAGSVFAESFSRRLAEAAATPRVAATAGV